MKRGIWIMKQFVCNNCYESKDIEEKSEVYTFNDEKGAATCKTCEERILKRLYDFVPIEFEVIKPIYWDNWGTMVIAFSKGDICKGEARFDEKENLVYVSAESPIYEGISDSIRVDSIKLIRRLEKRYLAKFEKKEFWTNDVKEAMVFAKNKSVDDKINTHVFIEKDGVLGENPFMSFEWDI